MLAKLFVSRILLFKKNLIEPSVNLPWADQDKYGSSGQDDHPLQVSHVYLVRNIFVYRPNTQQPELKCNFFSGGFSYYSSEKKWLLFSTAWEASS